jgi:TrmH family RNA methyltransferase
MKVISSPHNARLKTAIRLKTSRGRKTQRRIIVFGLREVQRAMASGIQPLEVFLCSERLPAKLPEELQTKAPESTVFYDLSPGLMQRLQYGDREIAVVAVAQRPPFRLDQLVLKTADPMVLILESVEKPGNIGAVLRSMDGAGASALILADPRCDVLHPNCIRASMGSVFTIPLAIATAEETIAWCQQRELQMLAARDSAVGSYMGVDFRKPTAIAFGNEAIGLSPAWQIDEVREIGIPMCGICDSLNVSVAAAVILYEALRQRKH